MKHFLQEALELHLQVFQNLHHLKEYCIIHLSNQISQSEVSVEIFVSISGRISVTFDLNVLNKVKFGMVSSCDLIYPEKRKSRSMYKIGRL